MPSKGNFPVMMKSKPRPLVTVSFPLHENSLVLNLFFLAAAHFRKFLKSSLSQGNMRIHRNNDFETYLRKPCNFYCCWWFAVSPLCPDFLILTVTVFQLTVPNCCSHCRVFFLIIISFTVPLGDSFQIVLQNSTSASVDFSTFCVLLSTSLFQIAQILI